MLNLCLDIGNTRTKIGFFDDNQIRQVKVFDGDARAEILDALTNQMIQNFIFSTVKDPRPSWILDHLEIDGTIINLSAETPIPFKNAYKTPQTLGKDRLAAIAGALALFPDQHCLVIDLGTCVTYDFLTAEAVYLGGNISPGWQMRLDAMEHFTARLPRPIAKIQEDPIGKSTATALQNGAFYGLLHEIEGYIGDWQEKFPLVNVLLTGGDADFFAKNLKSQIFVNQNLVLIGLNKILNYNV